ncbi:MAG: hypothetical protein FWC51_00595, partial [Proteobacteria bacterium]|nr:hypothetical protein [Pseudomonadota bacterium]
MNDRKYHHDRVVRGWLDAGKWVVFDRYSYSNIFSVAKCPKDVWEEKIQFLEKAEFEWWNLPRPDYNFYLYLPPEVSYALRNVGSKNTGDTSAENAGADIHEKDFTLQRDVTEAYRYLTQRRPKEWSFVDQMRDGVRMPADAVFDLKIKPIIDRMIKGME